MTKVDEIMELATILGDSRYLAGAGKASREDVQDGYCNLRTAIESLANDVNQAIKLLALMFDKYEDGVQCYEDPEDCAGFMGNAVELNGDEFSEIVELLDRLAPKEAS